MSDKLPLELLKEKYIPLREFPEKFGVDESVVMDLIDRHKIKYAEFKAPGDTRRSIHANYEEVLTVLDMKEKIV